MEGEVPRGAGHMIVRSDKLWVSCDRDRRVACFDPEMGRTGAEIQLSQRITCLALTGSALLVGCARCLSPKRGWLHTVDYLSEEVVSTAELPGQPRAIVGEGETAWVACGSRFGREGTIERVNLGNGEAIVWRVTEWKVSDLALVDDELLAAMSLQLAVPMDSGQVT